VDPPALAATAGNRKHKASKAGHAEAREVLRAKSGEAQEARGRAAGRYAPGTSCSLGRGREHHGGAPSLGTAGMSTKKKSLRAAEQDRPDVKARRDHWREKSTEVNLRRLVFLDESGAKTNMTRLYGRSFNGRRIAETAPHGHWCTTTMPSSIRLDGSTAAMVVEGPHIRSPFKSDCCRPENDHCIRCDGLVRIMRIPLRILVNCSNTLIWCHQSSPKSNQ